MFSGVVDLERCLWSSDGGPGGTFRLAPGGQCVPMRADAAPIVEVAEGIAYLVAGLHPYRLWRTDGTVPGTWPLIDFADAGLWSRRHEVHASPALDRVFFLADDGIHGAEPWVSDGRPGGAQMLRDLAPGALGSQPRGFQEVAGAVLFFHRAGAHWELWRTDGTPAGTARTAVPRAQRLNVPPGPLHPVAGGAVFFLQTAVPCAQELWTTDATPAGTRRLASFVADPCPSVGPPPTVTVDGFAGSVFFVADDGRGPRLWRSDGTIAGTASFAELPPGARFVDGFPDAVRPFLYRGELYFPVDGGAERGTELWSSDGRPGGTRLAVDICPGKCSSKPQVLGEVGGEMLLVAFDERFGVNDWVIGRELWRSDGTPGGTLLYTDLGGAWTVESTATRLGERLLFVADTLDRDWWSFGPEGLRQLTDELFTRSFLPQGDVPIAVVGDRALFFAEDGCEGMELWSTDGTAEGTWMQNDLQPRTPAPRPGIPGGPIEVEHLDERHVRLTWVDTTDDEDGFMLKTADWRDWEPVPHLLLPPNTTSWVLEVDPGVTQVEVSSVRDGRLSFSFATQARVSKPLCEETDAFLCLGGGSFRASARWRNQHAPAGAIDSGAAQAMPAPARGVTTGAFSFFTPDNLEVALKVLDGRPVNDYFWVLHGGLSEVEHWIAVERVGVTGVERWESHNPPGHLCGGADTTAFCDGWSCRPDSEYGEIAAAVAAPAAMGTSPPGPATRFLALATPPGAVAPSHGACVPDEDTLCLLGGELAVSVDWTDQHNGGTGVGRAIPSTDLTGFFWFFHPENVELVVKALDGRTVNGKIWVFYGALTDVGYTLRVEHLASETHAVRSYENPPGTICGRGDTAAF